MIDNICLKILRYDNEEILEHLQDSWRRDDKTYTGHIRNMGIYISPGIIIIHGSLAKFLNGENVSTLTFGQIEKAIRELENETGLSLETAIVTTVELGISLITSEPVAKYLKLFGFPARFTRHEYAKITGVETISYSSPTGSYQFTGYDKVQEVQSKKKQKIPESLEGKNILRLEYKIKKRRGIKAKFRRDLTAYDLFNPILYRKLQNLFDRGISGYT